MATGTENFMKLERVIFEICERTVIQKQRQTYGHAHRNKLKCSRWYSQQPITASKA